MTARVVGRDTIVAKSTDTAVAVAHHHVSQQARRRECLVRSRGRSVCAWKRAAAESAHSTDYTGDTDGTEVSR